MSLSPSNKTFVWQFMIGRHEGSCIQLHEQARSLSALGTKMCLGVHRNSDPSRNW